MLYLVVGARSFAKAWAARCGVASLDWKVVREVDDFDCAPAGTMVVDLCGVLHVDAHVPDYFVDMRQAFERGVRQGRLTLEPFTSTTTPYPPYARAVSASTCSYPVHSPQGVSMPWGSTQP